MGKLQFFLLIGLLLWLPALLCSESCKEIVKAAGDFALNIGRLQPEKPDPSLKGTKLTLFLIDYRLQLLADHLLALERVLAGSCSNPAADPTLGSQATIEYRKLTILRSDYQRWRYRVDNKIPEPAPQPEPEYSPGDFRAIIKSFESYPAGEARMHLSQYILAVQTAREGKDFRPEKFIDDRLIFNITGLLYAISREPEEFRIAKEEGLITALFFPISSVTYDTFRSFIIFLTGGSGKIDELIEIIKGYDAAQKQILMDLFLNLLSNLKTAEGYQFLLTRYRELAQGEKEQVIGFFFRLILESGNSQEFVAALAQLQKLKSSELRQLAEFLTRVTGDTALTPEQKLNNFFAGWDLLFREEITNLQELKPLLDRISTYDQLTGNNLLRIFIGIIEDYRPEDLPLWQTILGFVAGMADSQQEKTIWMNFLPGFKLANLREMVRGVKLARDKAQVTVIFEPFLFTNPVYEKLQNNVLINTRMRELLAERYNLVYDSYAQPLFRVRGSFALQGEKYVPMVEFWSEQNRLLIFARNLEVGITEDRIHDDELGASYTALLDDFDQFLLSLYTIAENNPKLVAPPPAPEQIGAVIRAGIVMESTTEKPSTARILEGKPVAGFYLSTDLFLEKDGQRDLEAEQLLGSDLRGRVVEYLNAHYLITEANSLMLRKPDPDRQELKINLQYYQTAVDPRFTGQHEIDILFRLGNSLLQVNRVYFDPKLLPGQQQELRQAVIGRIALELAAFFRLQRRADRADLTLSSRPTPPTTGTKKIPAQQVLSNFLIPGYTMQLNLKPEDPLFKKIAVTGWNWSNFALLSTAVTAQLIFIGSGYQQEAQPWFYLSLGAAALSVVDGLLGVVCGF